MNLRKKQILSFIFLSFLFSGLLLFRFNIGLGHAGLLDQQEGFEPTNKEVAEAFPGLTGEDTDARDLAVAYIQYFLTFLGLIFLVLIIWSGATWMMSNGNEEEIKKARSRLIASVIGMIIILSAYALTAFVVNFTQDALDDVL